jgi:hypothetical protein
MSGIIKDHRTKIIHPCDMNMSHTEERTRYLPMFVKIEYKDGRLSITGVVGPYRSGNAAGGCGQIDMEFRGHLDDLDLRYPEGWSKDLFEYLLAVWDLYHLNDMKAECVHQRRMGWTWKTHPSAVCPVCGYSLGHAWLSEDVPQDVIDWLFALPDTDRTPAWV